MSECLSQTKGVRQKVFGDMMLEVFFLFFFNAVKHRETFKIHVMLQEPKSVLIHESGVFISGNLSGIIQLHISHLDSEVAIISIVLCY